MTPDRPPTRPTGRVVAKYTLLQLPEMAALTGLLLLLDVWFDLSAWVYGLVLGIGAAWQVILFPFVWRAFDDRFQTHRYSMDGRVGVAMDRLDPDGRVRVRGEVWRAELRDPGRSLEAGQAVRVCATRGLVLLVEADTPDAPDG